MKRKLRVGVIFGGRSAEHEVSIVSARTVIQSLKQAGYDVLPIGVTKEGRWVAGQRALPLLEAGALVPARLAATLLADPSIGGLVPVRSPIHSVKSIDVIFPLIHGPFGEDGTLQGLLDLSALPYVGAGVLSSALGMDKVVQKKLLTAAGLRVTPFLSITETEWRSSPRGSVALIERTFPFPVFVKPANMGSSVGITKVKRRADVAGAINRALTFDTKAIVEKGLDARDIEVAVIGNDHPRASKAGEVVSSREFYDYRAKYVESGSKTVVPARILRKTAEIVRKMAVEAFKTLECAGMARVDFLVTRAKNEPYISEINTIPGFTGISMYPKLWAASGLPLPKLVDRLVRLARSRHRRRARLKRTVKLTSSWYRK